ncbi:MAG: PhzF family phenazine biosynthesis protein [Rhodothermaceae bacterium]|nr:PhzF family phenazine biosynthesis protein [Rhodothermaceae bacterium]MXX57711.1 PhzF family phenazine biosynthesis protein [Rhodothermaceae bacterium]MYD18113.1 PhzF family phenazine biosynthesis protein [Rhodothermaceae bacterium]MYD55687.1 PhzF family phenazine biosynthesis protein [Rhodothermaceae bacterium]MYI44043.1 PhzF family phenazine biosynthesis protein [Rhodothermaceae bacterium]
MASFPFFQVDAFASEPLHGNPCAVVLDADGLTSDQMQAIAREQNLSETAFILHSDKADVRARYFTPAEEIPLAGHPTIASIHTLIETNRIKLTGAQTRISLELKAGIVPVDVLSAEGQPREIVMTQLKPKFLSTVPHDRAASVFGLSTEDLVTGRPVQVVSTGTPQLMVPVQALDCLRKIQVDIDALSKLRREFLFFSVHLFAKIDSGTFARHFAGPPDVFEDPFTGSATGGMGAYLWHYGLMDAPDFLASQGTWMQRPGQARVRVLGPRNDISAVQVGGEAVTVIAGTLHLP